MNKNDPRLTDGLATLCANGQFTQLLAEWNSFTPFRVMRAERAEIRHTTTLAWLLDPRASHQMGDTFLRCFLEQLSSHWPFDLASASTANAQVYREIPLSKAGDWLALEQEQEGDEERKTTGNRLDVLVEGRSTGADGRSWAVAIEAKIDSKQGAGQLPAYASHLKQRFGSANVLMLYLTVNEDKPEGSDGWINVLWGGIIVAALEDALSQSPRIGQRVREFLGDYSSLLRYVAKSARDPLTQRIADFANTADVAPILRTLKWHSKALREVRGWSANGWERTFWQHESLLRKCMAEVHDPSAQLVWQTVRQHLAPESGFTVLTDRDKNNLAVQFIPKDWPQDELLAAGGRWNLCYHAEFRNEQRDIELKLYLPRGRDVEAQKALVRKLIEHASWAEAFHPKPKPLADYLAPGGKTLKLETMKINWTLAEDGTIAIDEQALAAFGADFAARCAAHTAAIRAVFGAKG